MVLKPDDDYKEIYVPFLITFCNYMCIKIIIFLLYRFRNRTLHKTFHFPSIVRRKRRIDERARELKSSWAPLHAVRFIIVTLTYHRHRSFSLYLLVGLCLLPHAYVMPRSLCKCIIGFNCMTLSEKAGESRLPIGSERRSMERRQEAASTVINSVASSRSFRDRSMFGCK